MIREDDPVVLTTDLPEYGLKRGDLGAAVFVYPGENGFEVEFVTLDGETVALVMLLPSQIRAFDRKELTHARTIDMERTIPRFLQSLAPLVS